ncbi:nucleoside hydrolase [Micrococcales bacterium 31B]|nr:nucleoside hydrolase [Micrococcales bacterium 31B]
MTTRVLFDCDPGHDDAIAMLLAAGSPDLELVAVTTVAGNQTLEKVTRNARATAEIAGLAAVPIAAGAAGPLVGPQIVAEDIHGDTGMDGPVLPEPTYPLDPRHGAQVIIDEVMASEPGTLTLVATGALTNLALAVRLQPLIAARVREVIFMGGSVGLGNYSAAAEFNIAVDPEAAQIVVSAPWKTTMVGLNVTHQALATPAVRQRITGLGTAPARFVGELLEFFGQTYRDVQGFDDPPIHDAVAMALAADPLVCGVQPAPLSIELHGEHTRGMTVADLRGPAAPGCRRHVAMTLDAERLWDALVVALTRLG